ncbi:MAG TPA: hypothetical protein VK853_08245 [Ilumatobacteraceae bacterium]|nr:hypothetical protein [Ilumatobacteraceae bacterium]
MDLAFVIPLVVLAVVLITGWLWYRRSLAALRPDDTRPVSGVRLTAEALHRHDHAPWRVVYEIGGALGGVDHVLVGPPGLVAISTVVADRPRPQTLLDASGEARLVADAAVARGPVDEIARPSGVPCRRWARVFWGSPDTRRPAHEAVVQGFDLVEGQRLGDWLVTLAAEAAEPLDPHQVDRAWQAVVTGIGRPDPLAPRQ